MPVKAAARPPAACDTTCVCVCVTHAHTRVLHTRTHTAQHEREAEIRSWFTGQRSSTAMGRTACTRAIAQAAGPYHEDTSGWSCPAVAYHTYHACHGGVSQVGGALHLSADASFLEVLVVGHCCCGQEWEQEDACE